MVRSASSATVSAVMPPAASMAFLRQAPRAPGTTGDAVQKMEGALLHVLAGDVLERLPAREPAGTVADFHVARDGAKYWDRRNA